MSFDTTYKQLFEIQLLHNYFLNDGINIFLSMNDTDQKQQLKLYDISEFIEITPSQDTLEKMAGHRIVFKQHKSGFSAYCKIANNTQSTPFVKLPDNLSLKFVIKLKDAFFSNYTKLTAEGAGIFFFGNTKPSTEGVGFEYIAKSSQNKLITDTYKLSSIGSKAILEDLKGRNRIGVFGIAQFKMIGDTTNLSILTVGGNLKSQLPVFKIHFDNRATFWRYKRSIDDSEIFITAFPNPLTKYGFIEVTHNGDKFPNPNANHLIPDNNNFFSEIYI